MRDVKSAGQPAWNLSPVGPGGTVVDHSANPATTTTSAIAASGSGRSARRQIAVIAAAATIATIALVSRVRIHADTAATSAISESLTDSDRIASQYPIRNGSTSRPIAITTAATRARGRDVHATSAVPSATQHASASHSWSVAIR